jgi:hypothetical protein
MREQEPRVVLTIGHSTRTWEAFLELLRAHRVKRVIDVRSIPKSRHNPQFNRAILSKRLRVAKIGYVHLQKLAGLRHPRRDSPNMGWRNASFRGFADYMQTSDFDAPFAYCRCADGARSSSRGHSEQETYSGSFADSFCTRARSSHHVPNPESGRRASRTPKPISGEFTTEPKNQGLRTSSRRLHVRECGDMTT